MVFLRFLLSIERTSRCRLIRDAGTPDDVDAVVWQLVANGGGPIFNFLYESGRLVLLNDTCGKIDGALFWKRTDIR